MLNLSTKTRGVFLLHSSASTTRRLLGALSLMSTVACGAKQEARASRDAGVVANAGNTPSAEAGLPNGFQSSDPGVSQPDMTVAPDSAATTGTTSVTEPATVAPASTSFMCGGNACACSDGIDNDGDGVIDGMDQECTGPLDDEEGSFATGIPGDNRDPKWQDCFFDGNSGAGDDGCRYHTACLTGDKPSSDDDCAVAQQCIDFCQPLTPPGCDCFGCCEVPVAAGTIGVLLSETCSLANIDDPEACPRCEPATHCSNECGECELCLGKTLADLPASCAQNTPPTASDAGTPPSENDGGFPDTDDPDTTDPDTTDPDTDGPDTTDPDTTDPSTPDLPSNSCDRGVACTTNADCQAGDYCRLGCCIDYTPQVF
jgi:hypothetical protein